MGFLDNLLGKSKGQKQEKIGPESLPPGWTQLTDPSSGDIYYFNEASGESTWDRPAVPSSTRPTRPSTTALPSTQQAPAVPRSYEEIHAQAIAGIAAALKRGLRALEVEFPAIAQTNKLSDGSASSQALVRRAHAGFNAKVAAALSRDWNRVILVCGDGAMVEEMRRLEASGLLPPNARCLAFKDRGSVGLGARDLVLACQPASISDWVTAADISAVSPVVVLNGYQYNGYKVNLLYQFQST
jgi:hypothetical protein